MKRSFSILLVLLILGIIAYAVMSKNDSQNQTSPVTDTQPVMTSIDVTAISHATAVLDWGGTSIYTDPVGDVAAFSGQSRPDIIMVTDIHGDHFSTSTLSAITTSSTLLIVPKVVADQLPKQLASSTRVLANGEMVSRNGFTITAIPMYNLPETADARHTKGRGNGYVIERDGRRVYVAGDTSATPEMQALQHIEIAFIPMNMPFTMSVEEAAAGVLAFKPAKVYPYHYRGQTGLSDINKFKQLVNAGDPNIEVILLNWYPDNAQ